ncbi:hypothetical protein DER29_0520 [Micromonospora sp. M71_S20]|uniref:hypothetical protein n=1 Tax=Micromonospora sp. M71_S20 TaxID=592872 RepID=UPI000F19CC17|nr:hypothetical protein [Micromonospora sp. M71_S20]RLK22681.1 hypothetical protein DER29_0520 [Micromonospora sp. M71_S20]
MGVMRSAIDPRTIPADLKARLLASLADHMREAETPRDGVIAAAKAAKAEALRNGWTPAVAQALGELVATMGGDLIGAAIVDAEKDLRKARAVEREAETFHRRAVEGGRQDAAEAWAAKLAAARDARIAAEAEAEAQRVR